MFLRFLIKLIRKRVCPSVLVTHPISITFHMALSGRLLRCESFSCRLVVALRLCCPACVRCIAILCTNLRTASSVAPTAKLKVVFTYTRAHARRFVQSSHRRLPRLSRCEHIVSLHYTPTVVARWHYTTNEHYSNSLLTRLIAFLFC